jgi:hypothetical protein
MHFHATPQLRQNSDFRGDGGDPIGLAITRIYAVERQGHVGGIRVLPVASAGDVFLAELLGLHLHGTALTCGSGSSGIGRFICLAIPTARF